MTHNCAPEQPYGDSHLRKPPILLWLFWFSILFSPLVNFGVLLRVDQIVLPLVFYLLLVQKKFRISIGGIGRRFAQYALLCTFLGAVGGVVSLLMEGIVNWYFIVNWPVKVLLHLIIGLAIIELTAKHETLLLPMGLRPLLIGTAIVGMIAILQVSEFRGYIPDVGINKFLSQVYPYRMEREPMLTVSGYQLKTGRIGQATATFDGHPILLGNYLAFTSLVLFPLLRFSFKALILIPMFSGLFLSLARASVLAWFGGLVLFLAMLGIHSLVTSRLKLFFRYTAMIALAVLVLGTMFVASPLGETVRWRWVTAALTIQGFGPEEGRLAQVWPAVINTLRETGALAWLFGKPGGYVGPTDSQYLWVLANAGIMGLLLFTGLHLYMLLVGWKAFISFWNTDKTMSLLGWGYTCAVVALLLMYIANPVLQGDRLLTTLVVVSLMLDNDVKKLKNAKKNYGQD